MSECALSIGLCLCLLLIISKLTDILTTMKEMKEAMAIQRSTSQSSQSSRRTHRRNRYQPRIDTVARDWASPRIRGSDQKGKDESNVHRLGSDESISKYY